MQTGSVSPISGTYPKLGVWWIRIGAVVAVVMLLAMSVPLIWTALSAGVGLLALAGIAALGMTVMAMLPLGIQRLENRVLALRKAEARKNPIEQLQNEVMRRAERLVIFRKALVTVGGQIESIRQLIEESQAKSNGQVIDRQQKALQRLEQFHNINIARLNQAQAALHEFKNTVEQKQREWEIALAIDDASQAMDPNAGGNLIQDLLSDTALRAVQDRFNNVFAELDVQMRSMDAPTRDLLDKSSMGRIDALSLPVSVDQQYRS
jgi:membrane protein YqaA with SNARE-associated domain